MDHEAAKKLLFDECCHFECYFHVKVALWGPLRGYWVSCCVSTRCTTPPVAMVIFHFQIQWGVRPRRVVRRFQALHCHPPSPPLAPLLQWLTQKQLSSLRASLKEMFVCDVMLIIPFQARWSGDLSSLVSSGGQLSEFCDWLEVWPSVAVTLWLGEACDWMSELMLDSWSSRSLLASSGQNTHTGILKLQVMPNNQQRFLKFMINPTRNQMEEYQYTSPFNNSKNEKTQSQPKVRFILDTLSQLQGCEGMWTSVSRCMLHKWFCWFWWNGCRSSSNILIWR